MLAPVTKSEFYRRYASGEFGNRPRSWSDAASLLASGFSGCVTVRSTTPGGKCRYGVPVKEAVKETSGFRFNESMPDDLLLLQGEVFVTEDGRTTLTYSTERGLSMRSAMQLPRSASGSAALAILRQYLWPSSFDDVVDLMRDSGGVVEFGAYEKAIGDLPHRNTVIWEVRNY